VILRRSQPRKLGLNFKDDVVGNLCDTRFTSRDTHPLFRLQPVLLRIRFVQSKIKFVAGNAAAFDVLGTLFLSDRFFFGSDLFRPYALVVHHADQADQFSYNHPFTAVIVGALSGYFPSLSCSGGHMAVPEHGAKTLAYVERTHALAH
jgi:hypothetical protein